MEAEQPRWDPKEIDEAAAALTEFLTNQEQHQKALIEILDLHVVSPVGVETRDRVLAAVTMYAGEDVADFFLGYLTLADQDLELMEAFHDKMPADVADYLRRVLAMYGTAVTEAAILVGESLDSWRDFRREVYHDVISSEWRVRIEIERYRGDVLTLRETPTSTLVLAHAMLDTLMATIESAGVQSVDPELVEPLRERVVEFLDATADVPVSAEEPTPTAVR